MEYARHFHFFEDPSAITDIQYLEKEPKYSGWLLEAFEFTALPGRGVQCLINGKHVLVSIYRNFLKLKLTYYRPKRRCKKSNRQLILLNMVYNFWWFCLYKILDYEIFNRLVIVACLLKTVLLSQLILRILW